MADPALRIGPGPLVMVVGPSGAGKDTLIAGAKAILPTDLPVYFPRRQITRIPDRQAEDHDTLSKKEFAEKRTAGRFALHWQAHGLGYGIASEIDQKLGEGTCVVFNGSRSVIGDAVRKYRTVVVAEITAPIDVLTDRLAARGRENLQDITRRLKRAKWSVPTGTRCLRIVNSGSAESGIKRLADAIASVAGR